MKSILIRLASLYLISGVLFLAACAPSGVKLDGSAWQLVEMNRAALPEGVETTLTFEKDGAGGRAACNSYGSNFSQKGSQLTFEQTFSTEMYCEDVMQYESDYFAALSQVRSFALEGERLILLDAQGGVVLVFK